jgi:RHS repeat-associated protein
VYSPDAEPALFLGRGYTGHEHLPEFGLINMNARLYDPAVGRFLSPDPFVQAPDFSQSFNRYSYCLNNPLIYTDPTGEYFLIDDLIAAIIGGTVNLVTNIIQGNIHSIGQGFASFGVGAAGTWAGLYAGPIAAGAIIGAGNSFVNQGFGNNGNWNWGNISGQQVFFNGIMGGVTGQLGASLGQAISPYVSNLTSGIGGQAVQQAITQGITGSAVGFTMGTGLSLLNGESWNDALKAGGQGALMGFGIGTATGLASGLRSAYKAGENPWTGKKIIDNSSNSTITNNHGYEYDPRVRMRALDDPTSHNFPYSFDESILSTTPIVKPDGYLIYRLEGTMNGINGYYEIGVNKGIIDHRFFRPIKW